jgi:hypothetical protein
MKLNDNKFNIGNKDIYLALKGMEVKNNKNIDIILENLDLNKIKNLNSKKAVYDEIKNQFIEQRDSMFLVKKFDKSIKINTLYGLYKSIQNGFVVY